MSLLAGLSQQGDSIAAHNSDPAAHGAVETEGIVAIGSSSLAYGWTRSTPDLFISSACPITNGIALAGASIRYRKNLSVGGTFIADHIQQFTEAIELRPRFIYAQLFSNDILSGATAATLWPSALAMIEGVRGTGTVLVLRITTNRTGDTSYTATMRTELKKLRNLARAASRRYPNVHVVDCYQLYTDPTSASSVNRTGYTLDGTHPSARGAYIEGKELAKIFALYCPRTNTFAAHADVLSGAGENYVLNAAMTTAAGGTIGAGASGVAPASVSVARTSGSGSVVVSVVARPAGHNALRLAFTGVAGDAFSIQWATETRTAGREYEYGITCTLEDATRITTPTLIVANEVGVLFRPEPLGDRKALPESGGVLTINAFHTPAANSGSWMNVVINPVVSGAAVVELESPYIVPAVL